MRGGRRMKFNVSSDTSLQMVGGGNKKQGTYASVYLMTNRGRKLCNCSGSMVRPEAAKRSSLGASFGASDVPNKLSVIVGGDYADATMIYSRNETGINYLQYTSQGVDPVTGGVDAYDLIIAKPGYFQYNSVLFKNGKALVTSSNPTKLPSSSSDESGWFRLDSPSYFGSPIAVSYSPASN